MADLQDNYVGRFWHTEENKDIVCVLCPRNCTIKEGKRGFCFVRQNIDGKLILTTYGHSSGFCIDPIEKKPLNHFYPGSSILSFGTAGCNLGCKFCQNWDISSSREFDRLTEQASPQMIAQCAKRFGCKSVAFTYNDPVIFAEYAIDIAAECRKLDVKTVAVTAGYISPEARREFFDCMDAANVDLKSFNDEFYKKFASGKLQPILDTLIYLKHKTDVWFEITTLLIPGENDSDKELNEMCDWIVKELGYDIPVHFSAFHPAFKMREYSATPENTLIHARSIAISNGIRYVYVGNVSNKEASSTYCHNCGKLLIERNWYELGEYHIKDKKCEYCNTACTGYFENKPGNWGSKRQPVGMR